MILQRGGEKPQIRHPVIELNASETEQTAALMRAADPEFWRETESQNITESIDPGAKWFGVKVSDEIVSVGSGRTTEWGGLIGVVATSKFHRCKGYAISVVSTLVKKLLEKNPLVMILCGVQTPLQFTSMKKLDSNSIGNTFS